MPAIGFSQLTTGRRYPVTLHRQVCTIASRWLFLSVHHGSVRDGLPGSEGSKSTLGVVAVPVEELSIRSESRQVVPIVLASSKLVSLTNASEKSAYDRS